MGMWMVVAWGFLISNSNTIALFDQFYIVPKFAVSLRGSTYSGIFSSLQSS